MRISEPRSVVVVEDDADLRAIYREMLERDGWEVRVFENPDDALRAIVARLPHVVLTDVNLNGQSGRELARTLRSDERTAGLAIVAASGSVIPTTPLLRMFDTFLRKPVDVTTLGAVLREVVDRRFAMD
ncbi:response regulator [Sandaracinus amylolyticus]|uniref:Chemotaxis protein methyltransferase CheR n=1 Tax=Sandaracinus amylolyticus TaxID=927083 RepID=A0A0F6W9C8_9BACT|nr:response regulator [Sandaracinus amylolyticus]AKF10787.1 Chemotaxis protein methyltransferase CheR [Sandaracinus amylolyticus]